MRNKICILLLFALTVVGHSQTTSGFQETPSARDAFGNLRSVTPETIFDGDFQHSRLPLLYDTINRNGSITWDATDRLVTMSLSAASSGDIAAMQTFEFYRYQPGKSQDVKITFNMNGGTTNAVKFAGYSDRNNGIEFQLRGSTPYICLYSNTNNGDQEITQTNWNIDPFDGTGPSGDTLDVTKTQILVIDLQALYVGRVRVGFNIGGATYYAHEFKHANEVASPYIQYASLPIRAGIEADGSATGDMDFICASISSEGGQQQPSGQLFSVYATAAAPSGSDGHVISLQPKTTFNGVENRGQFIPSSIVFTAIGGNSVLFKISIGQALTGESTTDVNTTYSMMETVTGTLSGSPTSVIYQVIATADTGFASSSPSTIGAEITEKIPVTLDHEGLQRLDGRLTVTAQGIGGSSTGYVCINFKEVK